MAGPGESIRVASAVLSLLVAAVLLFTGVIHGAQPYLFVHTIASYRILPPTAAGLVGVSLPYLQTVVALCIGFRIAEKTALAIATLVFGTFALAQIAALIRGMDIDCGCFGFAARQVSLSSAALPIVLVGACVVGIVGNRGRAESPGQRSTPNSAGDKSGAA
ncbi:MAG: MauE/DoxX family redox-associated membrane protein, partial [Pirellulales bacterium]